ncbi:MAG: hypothetical protein JWQ16_2635 [Novosphingobium sp.]|nr:hypothetical protein [Novosphingobium sp.]
MILRPLFGQRAALAGDERGATLLEFAFVMPVLVAMLMFLFDTGFYLYARSILGGEVQTAGRRSALETATVANQALLDANVQTAVLRLVKNGQVSFSRMAYKSYGRAQAKAESFTDTNGNGVCDNGEAFDDGNNNGVRDLDTGLAGQGNAKDVTIYTATLQYDRMFPLARLLGWSNRVSMSSTTILRNQPYDKQVEATVGHCT